jgi:hypothetical protein
MIRRLWCLVVAVGLLGACSVNASASPSSLAPPSPRVVDGYPFGGPADCKASGSQCALYVAEAERWLDSIVPGHAAVSDVEAYLPDYRNAEGSQLIADGSGGRSLIMVLTLADGSIRAVQVQCGIGVQPELCTTQLPMVVAR